MRIELDVWVTFNNAFNIGAGSMGGSYAKRPLLLDWQGLPYLPGSSFKGRLRHTCKQLEAALGRPTCQEPVADSMCPNGPEPGRYCLVCQLFGAPALPAPLVFSDLSLVEPSLQTGPGRPLAPVSLRYGVGVARRRRVAGDALLFNTEVFTPGGPVKFKGKVEGRLEANGLGLLLAGLENLVTLGGGKTAGLGWCQVGFDPEQIEMAAAEAKQRWLA